MIFILFFFSIILLIVLNIKKTFSFLENFVGSSFLEKRFVPSKNGLRATFPVIVFTSTIALFFIVDDFSLKLFDYLEDEKIEKMRQVMHDLYQNGQPLEGQKQADRTVDVIHKNIYNKGIFKRLVNNENIAPFIEFFDKKNGIKKWKDSFIVKSL